jgi:hypothetical protein
VRSPLSRQHFPVRLEEMAHPSQAVNSLAVLRLGGARVQAALVGVIVAAVIATLSVSGHLLPGVFNDDGAYLALGRALANGDGYRSTYLAGAPLQVKYPPAFPALLALLWRVARTPGAVQTIVTVINVAACGLAAALFWWIARVRLRLPIVVATAVVAIPFLLDPAIQYYTLVLSEPLFLLAMACAFVLVERRDDESDRSQTTRGIALGLILAFAVLLRTQAVALLAAIFIGLLLDRSRRRMLAVTAVISLPLIAIWHAYLFVASRHEMLATQASESSYMSFLTGTDGSFLSRELGVITGNAMDYLRLVAGYVGASPAIGMTVAVVLTLLAFVGALLLLRHHPILGAALLANGAMLLLWPAYQDRYLLPVLPLAGLAVGLVIRAVRCSDAIAAVALALVLLRQHDIRREVDVARASGKAPAISTPRFWLQGNSWFVDAAARWTLRSTARADKIAVVSPAGLWLYTGRQTVPMEVVEPRGAPSVFDVPGRYLASQISSRNVTVVLVESPVGTTAREIAAVRAACPTSLRQVDEFSGIAAWRVNPNDGCIAALDQRFRTASTSSAS